MNHNTTVVLMNPKFPVNVGNALRACAEYRVPHLYYSGTRIDPEERRKGWRLPREERIRAYQTVTVHHLNYPSEKFDVVGDIVPVAVEVLDNSEDLVFFEHPRNAIYFFGPEDNSLPKGIRTFCHRFVRIPTVSCLNLASAVATVLYDRHAKLTLANMREAC